MIAHCRRASSTHKSIRLTPPLDLASMTSHSRKIATAKLDLLAPVRPTTAQRVAWRTFKSIFFRAGQPLRYWMCTLVITRPLVVPFIGFGLVLLQRRDGRHEHRQPVGGLRGRHL